MAITIPTPQTQGAAALGGMTAIAADTPMQNLSMPDMGSTGRSLEKLGGAMATYAAHVKRIDDERRLLEFQVAWGEFERQALYDPDTGLMGLEGRDAFGSVESIRTRADEFMLSWQEEAGRLSGTARLAIEQYGVRSVESLLTRAAAREFQERERYNASLRAASTAAAQDRAVRNYSNPEQFALDVALAEATARSEAEATVRSSANAFSTGQAISFADYGAQAGEQQVDDPLQFGGFEEANDQAAAVQAAHAELIDTEVRNSVSQIYVRAIEESIGQGGGARSRNAPRSRELLRQGIDGGYISPGSPLVGAVQYHTDAAAAEYLVEQAVELYPGDIGLQDEHINSRAEHIPSDVREDAMGLLDRRRRRADAAAAQDQDNRITEAVSLVRAGKADQLDQMWLAQLPENTRSMILDSASAAQSDQAVLADAYRMPPERLTPAYVDSISGSITATDAATLRQMYLDSQQPDTLEPTQQLQSIVMERLRTMIEADTITDAEAAEVRGMIADAMARGDITTWAQASPAITNMLAQVRFDANHVTPNGESRATAFERGVRAVWPVRQVPYNGQTAPIREHVMHALATENPNSSESELEALYNSHLPAIVDALIAEYEATGRNQTFSPSYIIPLIRALPE